MHGIMRQRYFVYLFAGFASLILSCWASVKDTVINPDAICYLLSAQEMSVGLSQAVHLCDQAKWPLYSFLIFSISKITNFTSIQSAYFLNGIFSAISVMAFIAIIRFLKGTTRTVWLAVFVILAAHEFNAVREYIIRDHGFWSFYLLSILCLLHFFRAQAWRYALGWSVCLVIATLFRIEGAFYLLMIPFAALLLSRQKLYAFFKLQFITLSLLVILCVWLLLHPENSLDQLGRLKDIKHQILHGLGYIVWNYQLSAELLAKHVLNQYATHDANIVLFFALTAWYGINVIGNLSIVYASLILYGVFQKIFHLDRADRSVLFSYVAVSAIITIAFLLENMYFSKRYLLALSLTLMLWVPFALEEIVKRTQQRQWPVVLVVFLILIQAAGGIFQFGYSKKYINEAGAWLATHVPANATLYSNDYQVMYYSQHFGNTIFEKIREFSDVKNLAGDNWKKYDYLALRLDKKTLEKNEIDSKKFGTPIQIYKNKRGDEVVIYKLH